MTKRCVVGIGTPKKAKLALSESDAPTVWLPSMASLAAVLSADNRALLRTIQSKNPRSLTELAELTGRKVPNLSRTLRTMAGYGLVTLRKDKAEVRTTVLATEFTVILD